MRLSNEHYFLTSLAGHKTKSKKAVVRKILFKQTTKIDQRLF